VRAVTEEQEEEEEEEEEEEKEEGSQPSMWGLGRNMA
jgi:hypothetical protein